MATTGGHRFLNIETPLNGSFFDRHGDPRVQNWFMLDSPVPMLSLVAFYLLFSVKLGPRFMQNRKPYELKTQMMIYNLANVVSCVWLIYELMAAGWWNDYNFTCQYVDYSDNPKALRMSRAAWYYFMYKVVELLDTVFFVLRKKDNQITYLHLYHHSIMPLTTWATAKFWPGGHGSFGGLLNTVVHVVMYSYYFLAALGPKYQKYLWWKKYLTLFQLKHNNQRSEVSGMSALMSRNEPGSPRKSRSSGESLLSILPIQFVTIFVHQSQVFFNGCDIPKFIPLYFSLNSAYFMYLFGAFYVKTYISKKEKKTT